MVQVQGIGGAFLFSNDPGRLARWYLEHLGIEMETHPNGSEYYRVFRTRDVDSKAIRENPVFAIKKAAQKLPDDRSAFMINLRVDDLHSFLGKLRKNGVEIEAKVLEWKLGKHAWIKDLDGNRVELYEEILAEGV